MREPKSPYQRSKEWRVRNPQKLRAQRLVFVAVRNGSLKRKNCFCGAKIVEAHHEDYTKPLDVIWLCKKHHVIADKILRHKQKRKQGSLSTYFACVVPSVRIYYICKEIRGWVRRWFGL